MQRQISVKSWNANDTPTTVELTFVNGNKQYTVKRNPEYERKKARETVLQNNRQAALKWKQCLLTKDSVRLMKKL